MKNVVLKNITDKADDLANKWNDTKDPKYKDQWYKLLRTEVPVPDYLQPQQGHTYTLDKTCTD